MTEIFRTACDSITGPELFLMNGDARSGLVHILENKRVSFGAHSLDTDKKIVAEILETAKSPLFVYKNAERNALELYTRHGSWIMKVIANSITGMIVTAMPISKEDGDMKLQINALSAVISSVPKNRLNEIAIIAKLAALQHLQMDFLGMKK